MTKPGDPSPGNGPPEAPDSVRAVGRGFLSITLAKVWFLVTGTILNIGLPRLLGNAARFGEYRVANAFLTIINMVMITGTIQAVSKLVSEQDGRSRRIRATALRLQLWIGGGLALLMVAGADWIAQAWFQDAGLAPYLRIGALVVFAYGFYAVQVGVLNGLKRFSLQAGLDASFSTLKTALMVGAVLAGLSVAGAFWGFALAAAAILLASLLVIRRVLPASDTPGTPQHVALLPFMTQVMLYTLALNSLLQIDALLIKALATTPFLESLQTPAGRAHLALIPALSGLLPTPFDPALLARPLTEESASLLAGLYGAVKNVSLIPYQIIIAITFVVFPLVSRATFDEDHERARRTIRQTMRFTFLLAGLLAVTLASVRDPLAVLLFGPAYAVGAPAMGVLLLSTVFFTLFVVANTVVTGAGRPGASLALGVVAAALAAAAVAASMRLATRFDALLDGAAWALLGGMAVAAAVALVYLKRAFGAVLPWASFARTALATAGGFGVSFAWQPHGALGVLGWMAGMGLAFLALLALTGEFTREDLALAMKLRRG
jgi:stage V sporulation protein B